MTAVEKHRRVISLYQPRGATYNDGGANDYEESGNNGVYDELGTTEEDGDLGNGVSDHIYDGSMLGNRARTEFNSPPDYLVS